MSSPFSPWVLMDGDFGWMSAAGCRWRAARLERLFVALLPIVEIVGASSHEGRVVAVVTETLVAVAAQEIAQHARLVIMVDGKRLVHLLLEADGADAALSSQHRSVALERNSVLSLEVPFASGLGVTSEQTCPKFGIRRISVSLPCVDLVFVAAAPSTAAHQLFVVQFRLFRVSLFPPRRDATAFFF
jgi:hypothetical protein